MADLTDRLAYWQKVLRLQDWDISLDRVSAREMDGSWGKTNIAANWKEARCRILADGDDGWTSDRFGSDFDPEETLVHELLHIPLDYWKRPDEGTLEHDYKEAFIDQLARALVGLDRRCP